MSIWVNGQLAAPADREFEMMGVEKVDELMGPRLNSAELEC
jgi:hypothetical protein